jgi:hypothetical protein
LLYPLFSIDVGPRLEYNASSRILAGESARPNGLVAFAGAKSFALVDWPMASEMKAPKTTDEAASNGSIHRWYNIVLGYSNKLVTELLDELSLGSGEKVVDPFCGAATTLVECLKREIGCLGIDANPSSCFAARVKTNWRLHPTRLGELLSQVRAEYQGKISSESDEYHHDPTFTYMKSAGMIERGWISPAPLRKALTIKRAIGELKTSGDYKNALMLALVSEVVSAASNVRFGPELYCIEAKADPDVMAGFSRRVTQMQEDLDQVASPKDVTSEIFQGDSRNYFDLLQAARGSKFSAVICSPPYPAEHDYTRNARLELAFLEQVSDRDTLRAIKRSMIRSHTKGIYKGDRDASFVRENSQIKAIVKEVEQKIEGKTYGFARLYPRVVQEYFGGMKRHLKHIRHFLCSGARCAYILGDQSSYLRVHIPTAEILSGIAQEVGFKRVEIRHWRTRWSTTTSKTLDENILLMENPR